ncbi:hypothetical protein DPMN_068919 [Dreissena polymorpha]|uniref:Uncharacterized protein n=1 Tax=Dreissena polymorpha TaxID=45954 RepID=A0A9D4BML8_DREPO|nr:hypothetical protein DPMN_068919 [Dreissena polymorpha]
MRKLNIIQISKSRWMCIGQSERLTPAFEAWSRGCCALQESRDALQRFQKALIWWEAHEPRIKIDYSHAHE